MKTGKSMRRTALLGLAAVWLSTCAAQATTYNWNKVAWVSGGYNWNDAANWNSTTGEFPNAVGDIADIRANLGWGAGCPVKLNETITVGTIYIGDTSAGWSPVNITAGTAGSLIMDETGTANVTITKTLANWIIDTIWANIALNDNLIVDNAATDALGGITLAGIISDFDTTARTLTKNGAGLLTLSGTNTFSGGTTINRGTLTIGTGGTLGATTGTLSVNNNNTAAGTQVVLNLDTAADTAVGSLSGTIATPSSGANTVTINTQVGRTFTINQTSDATYAGVIAGLGNVTLGSSSTHALTLSGVNTYTGETRVMAGTLKLTGSGSITNSTPITVDAGATLDVSGRTGGSFTIGNGVTLGGDGAIAGTLIFGSGAQFAFVAGQTLEYSGADITFGANFGVESLIGLTGASTPGTYTLISGNVDLTGVNNVGVANAYDLGKGLRAYFQDDNGLQLVVIFVAEGTMIMIF